jgi:hypothetical protein
MKDIYFGNVKCKICGEYINPIRMRDHLLVCELQVENRKLREALILVTDDLEDEIETRYSVYDNTKGDNARKYKRDIEPVKIARQVLEEYER